MMNACRLMRFGLPGFALLIALISGRVLMHEQRSDARAERIQRLIEEREAAGNSVFADTPASANTVTERQASPAMTSSQSAGHQVQLGTNYLAAWNLEDLFINRMKLVDRHQPWAWGMRINGETLNTAASRERGLIDDVTGEPERLPPGLEFYQSPPIFSAIKENPRYYRGEWVAVWEGGGRGSLQPHLQAQGFRIISSERGRLVFRVPPDVKEPFVLLFKDPEAPVRNLRLFRPGEQALLNAGKVWNPRFVKLARDYDVIRTMVTQDTNRSLVRRWDMVATPDDPYFSTREPMIAEAQKPPFGRYGVPYEYLFELALETDTALWVNIPVQIGSPLDHTQYKDRLDDFEVAVAAKARTIIDSPEWDRFARAFADRLVASGYPPGRPIYVELGNEIWNYGWPFSINTKYADGIGRAFQNAPYAHRHGYGVLAARWISALEAALAAHSDYRVIHVIGSHTANPDSTRVSLDAMNEAWRARGLDPDALFAKTGLALTTYHGGAEAYQNILPTDDTRSLRERWERAIRLDTNNNLARRMHAYYVESPASVSTSLRWIVQRWESHARIARQYGVSLIGAYEGGSHDVPPYELSQSMIFMDWWTDYHWGFYGVDVVRQVNKAILDVFPGAILSNFISIGSIGKWNSPWSEGHYDSGTQMFSMWDEFLNRDVSTGEGADNQ